MCDYDDIPSDFRLSRRAFAGGGALAALSACAPMDVAATSPVAAANGLIERAVSFAAPGGLLDGVFIHPAEGKHPAAIIWPDIAGLRPAKVEMGRRLAAQGYAVFVGNPYYRSVAGQQFADLAQWRAERQTRPVQPWVAKNTPEAIMETGQALVAWLDAQDAVDNARGIGVQGHCYTGSWTILMAFASPDRIKAAAAYHPGRLADGDDVSALSVIDKLRFDQHVIIGISEDDVPKRPEEPDLARAAARRSAGDVKVEVFPAMHGWTVIDSPNYNEAEAARAQTDLLAMYAHAL